MRRGELRLLHHAGDTQVLEHHGLEAAGECRGEPVQVEVSGSRHAPVETLATANHLRSVLRAFGAP